MRILIAGAGIAGLTLAALLKQRGITPTVIEKSKDFGQVGYMIGLFPLGSKIFHGLGCFHEFLNDSIPSRHYQAYTESGKLLKSVSLQTISDQYGDYQTTTRYDLIDVLQKQCDGISIQFNTTVTDLNEQDDKVIVQFNNGQEAEFDLVVGADGLHSRIRSFILKPEEVEHFNTGWGGWVWWSKHAKQETDAVQEYWGSSCFLGSYPVKGKTGVIAAVPYSSPEQALKGQSRVEFINKHFAKLKEVRPDLFSEFPADDAPLFFWPLNDIRSKRWRSKRVVLLGDAAAAFLPTAGVGASMAMESAAVLNDILSRTDARLLPRALEFFEKRRRKRVEGAQEDSRKLSKLMFVKSWWQCKLRDYAIQYMSEKSLIKSITKDFNEPI